MPYHTYESHIVIRSYHIYRRRSRLCLRQDTKKCTTPNLLSQVQKHKRWEPFLSVALTSAFASSNNIDASMFLFCIVRINGVTPSSFFGGSTFTSNNSIWRSILSLSSVKKMGVSREAPSCSKSAPRLTRKSNMTSLFAVILYMRGDMDSEDMTSTSAWPARTICSTRFQSWRRHARKIIAFKRFESKHVLTTIYALLIRVMESFQALWRGHMTRKRFYCESPYVSKHSHGLGTATCYVRTALIFFSLALMLQYDCAHAHALTPRRDYVDVFCDFCQRDMTDTCWTCCEGCDFDLCKDCFHTFYD